jgi:O-antigen ligase
MKSKYLHFLHIKESILDQIIYFFFHLVLITYPFTINLNSITIIILFTLSVIKLLITRQLKFNTLHILFFLFFLSRLFSLYHTENIESGINIMKRSLSLLVFPLIFMVNKDFFSDKIKFIKVLIFSTFIACLYCLFRNFYFFINNDIPFRWWFDWKYNNYHLSKFLDFGPNYFSTLIIFNFLGIFFFRQKLKGYYWILLGVQLFFLLLLSSRGVILFFAVFSLIVFLKAAYNRYNLFGVFSSIIIAICLIFITFNSIPVLRQRFNKTLIELKSENSSTGQVGGLYNRFRKIEASSKIIKDHVLFGVGIGDVRSELKRKYILMDFKEGILLSFDAHNQYLESFLASGIIGFLSFSSILFFCLYRAFVSRDRFYFSLISLFMFFGLLESFMETHKGIVLFSILILCFFPYTYNERRVPIK